MDSDSPCGADEPDPRASRTFDHTSDSSFWEVEVVLGLEIADVLFYIPSSSLAEKIYFGSQNSGILSLLILDDRGIEAGAPEHVKVDELIESALNTEELLQIPSEHMVTGNQAAALLNRLCRNIVEQNLDAQDVLKDSRFQHLLNAVNGQISSVWNGNLVSLLRNLFVIRVDANNRVLRSVENEIHWRLRRLSLKNLAWLAGYYTSYAQTDGQKVLLSDIIKNVELRWTEITDAKTVTTLMTKLGPLSSVLMGRLEDK
eukprot:g44276.t1